MNTTSPSLTLTVLGGAFRSSRIWCTQTWSKVPSLPAQFFVMKTYGGAEDGDPKKIPCWKRCNEWYDVTHAGTAVSQRRRCVFNNDANK